MKLTTTIEQGLTAWVAAVAVAIEAAADRIFARRHVHVACDEDGLLDFSPLQQGKGKPPLAGMQARLVGGRIEPALPGEWLAALKGAVVEIELAPHLVLTRPLEFPRQAAMFLDGMVRSQIDRLTPWRADQACYGVSAIRPAADDRIALTLAATSRSAVAPLERFAQDVGIGTVTIIVRAGDGTAPAEPIRLASHAFGSSFAGGRDLANLLKLGLVGTAALAALTLVGTMVLGSLVDAHLGDVQAEIARQRAALRTNTAASMSSADALLARRKQTTPATVIVLDTLSKILPDGTHVVDLRIEGDKVQLAGLTQDAPALIRLLERSPQFSRATFFAPTTRTLEEAGERFHIEAHVNAYFGGGS